MWTNATNINNITTTTTTGWATINDTASPTTGWADLSPPTFSPEEFIPFTPAEKTFTMAAALLVGVVWLAMWKYAPKRALHVNNPRRRMHLVYAVVVGGLLGHFAGHAFPNALIHNPLLVLDTHFITLSMLLGVAAAVAFMKFSRTCGIAADQVVMDISIEPVDVFIDEDGEQGEYIRTTTGRTTAAFSTPVIADGHYAHMSDSQYYTGSSVEESTSMDGSPRSSSRSSRPRSQRDRVSVGTGGGSLGDDGSEDVARTSDHMEILWIRRKMAWILLVFYTAYGLSDALFMAYNNHGQTPAVLVACFWIYKLVNSLVLSGTAVFAYIHLHPRRCCCCCRRYRPMYFAWATVSVLASVASAIPVVLDVPPERVAMVVESLAFRLFCGFFSGWQVWVAFLLINAELRDTNMRTELAWWALFIASAVAIFTTGVFL